MQEIAGRERVVVSAAFHADETSPHIHFYFVPVTNDGELGWTARGKEAAAERGMTSKQIKLYGGIYDALHTDYWNHVGKQFGLKRGESTRETGAKAEAIDRGKAAEATTRREAYYARQAQESAAKARREREADEAASRTAKREEREAKDRARAHDQRVLQLSEWLAATNPKAEKLNADVIATEQRLDQLAYEIEVGSTGPDGELSATGKRLIERELDANKARQQLEDRIQRILRGIADRREQRLRKSGVVVNPSLRKQLLERARMDLEGWAKRGGDLETAERAGISIEELRFFQNPSAAPRKGRPKDQPPDRGKH